MAMEWNHRLNCLVRLHRATVRRCVEEELVAVPRGLADIQELFSCCNGLVEPILCERDLRVWFAGVSDVVDIAL